MNNVVNTLDSPFVPPFSPKYGPVFHRQEWEKEVRHMCDTDVYAIVHGASQVGISLSIVQSLKNRRGVVYVNLRGAEPERIAQRFAAAIGYTGKEIPHGIFTLHLSITLSLSLSLSLSLASLLPNTDLA